MLCENTHTHTICSIAVNLPSHRFTHTLIYAVRKQNSNANIFTHSKTRSHHIYIFQHNDFHTAVRPYRLREDVAAAAAAAASAHNFLDESGADADAEADADLDEEFGGRPNQTPVRTPDFVTLGQKYSVAIGSTIVLPCKINDSG